MNFFRFFIALILLYAGTVNQISAQQTDATVTLTKVVDASADEVWEVLRQLDNIDELSSFVSRVEWTGDHDAGGQRVCYPPAGQEGFFRESITTFDDVGRSYSYAVVEGVPAKGMLNNFKVVDLGYRRSMIVWTSTFEEFVDNPQMNEQQFVGFLQQAAGEMLANVAQAVKSE
ncbi:MAG: SRPBCC family protein [Bacteroidota bacterium]